MSKTNKIYLKVDKDQIQKALGYEIEHFSLHPEYVNGECIGLEVVAEPKEKIIYIPIKIFLEKNR